MTSDIPSSVESEQKVLGAILMDPGLFEDASNQLADGMDTFYSEAHRVIYETVCLLAGEGKRVDPWLLQQRLKDRNMLEGCGGAAYVSELPDFAIPTADFLKDHINVVNEKYLRRKKVEILRKAIESAMDQSSPLDLEKTEVALASLAGRTVGRRVLSGRESVVEAIDWLENRCQNRGKFSGLETPFRRLNSLTDGLQLGELSVIAARPSQGKTALAISLIEKICFELKTPTLFFSLEMHHRAIQARFVCSKHRINSSNYRRGELTEGDSKKLMIGFAAIAKSPLFITSASNYTADQILQLSRKFYREKKVQLIVIDYLQKIKPGEKKEKRTYELSETIQTLKEITKLIPVHVMALAQLNREGEKDKGRMPRLADIGESGQIEREADLVGLIYTPKEQNDRLPFTVVELLIAKQRDGATGQVDLAFYKEFTRFEDRPIIDAKEPY